MLAKLMLLAAGGGLGTVARYGISASADRLGGGSFPAGTLAVNLAGCLAIGALWALFERALISPAMRLFLFTGFLGGFTTFSAFGLETFHLLKEGAAARALLNMAVSNLAGVALVFAGYFAVRAMGAQAPL